MPTRLPSRRLFVALFLLFALATSSALGASRLRGGTNHAAHRRTRRSPDRHAAAHRAGRRRPSHDTGGSASGKGSAGGHGSAGATALVETAATAVAGTTSPATLLGDEAVESNHDYLSAGEAEAFRFSALAAGAAGAAHIYISAHNSATGLTVGLYGNAAGHPGTLLATGSIASPRTLAWNTVPLSSTQLTAGSTYWLAVLGTGGTLDYRDRSPGPCPSESSAQSTLKALPASWRTGTVYHDCPVSAYITAGAPSFPAEEPKSPLDPPPPTEPHEPPVGSEPPPVDPPPPPPPPP
ncbi:MAG TPA: hypothetical protein VNV37_12310, partial [Solirubrobacteraceae bacterium]|nr:hypothetical protein [Solirubrobacteraceae bacterium]